MKSRWCMAVLCGCVGTVAASVQFPLSSVAGERTRTVDVGRRLRPNYRDGKIVLFVAQTPQGWRAVRLP